MLCGLVVSGVWLVAGCCLGAGLLVCLSGCVLRGSAGLVSGVWLAAGCWVVGVFAWVCPEGFGWAAAWGGWRAAAWVPGRLGGVGVRLLAGTAPSCSRFGWVGCGTWVLVWGVWVWGCLGFWCVVVVVCVRGLGGGVMVVCVVWLAVGLVVVALVPPGPLLVFLVFPSV